MRIQKPVAPHAPTHEPDDDAEPEDATTLDELVRIAADSVDQLRGVDVYRVLNEARKLERREPGLLLRMAHELGARREGADFLSHLLEATADLDDEHGSDSLTPALRAIARQGGRLYDQAVALAKERRPDLAPAINRVDPRRMVAESMRRWG